MLAEVQLQLCQDFSLPRSQSMKSVNMETDVDDRQTEQVTAVHYTSDD